MSFLRQLILYVACSLDPEHERAVDMVRDTERRLTLLAVGEKLKHEPMYLWRQRAFELLDEVRREAAGS